MFDLVAKVSCVTVLIKEAHKFCNQEFPLIFATVLCITVAAQAKLSYTVLAHTYPCSGFFYQTDFSCQQVFLPVGMVLTPPAVV